ncbi:DUF3108 domain-containing protein [Alcanivorax sp. 1008]|uniref:DUF3108 domain-containing protein n=1 Tax=Alcanivorax sp. 1008 TaxID=2816853 RepID=UPI001DE9ED3F|nr:DUF3108 domain-containing protein [Alcanivorax sp. 1008]MCC1495657.1 DUF3108 domain-containing protein [Alcanivorax sp. 1008]
MRTFILPLLILAGAAGADPLQPFEAEFRLHVSRIPTTIKATLELGPTDQSDEYRMQMENRSFLIKNREQSFFSWNDCAPRSNRYEHQFRGFGIRREHSMTFNWDSQDVLFDDGQEQGHYPIEPDTLDELTMLLKAQCLLAEGEKEFTLSAAYGDKVRSHTFMVTGEETVSTPAGDIDTIVIEKKRKADSQRRTIFWVAPSLQYMLVKARHVENRALFGELLMIRYDGPAPLDPAAAKEPEESKEDSPPTS